MLIYKLISENTDKVYVGRTTKTLKQRLSCHRSHYKAWTEGTRDIYVSSFKVLEHGDCSIEMIEETEDDTREGFWIKELDACNIVKFDHDKAAYHTAYNKVWYEKHKDGILEKHNEKVPCLNCGRVVNRGSMWAHKRSQRCQNSSA